MGTVYNNACIQTGEMSSTSIQDVETYVINNIPADRWRDVGIQLGLPPATLDNIQSQTEGRSNDAIQLVLAYWQLNGPNTHTPKTIIDALKIFEVKYGDRSQGI